MLCDTLKKCRLHLGKFAQFSQPYGADNFTWQKINKMYTKTWSSFAIWFHHSSHCFVCCCWEPDSIIRDIVVNCRCVLAWRALQAHVQQPTETEAEMYIKARVKQQHWCRDCKHLIDAVGMSLSLLRTRVNMVDKNFQSTLAPFFHKFEFWLLTEGFCERSEAAGHLWPALCAQNKSAYCCGKLFWFS